jgi:hypothetical protein
MNEINPRHIDGREEAESGTTNSSSSIHSRQPAASFMERLGELEMENARLHRLVAELLIKNQQLRKLH